MDGADGIGAWTGRLFDIIFCFFGCIWFVFAHGGGDGWILGWDTMEMEGHKEQRGYGGWRIGAAGFFLKYLVILCVFCEFDLAFFWPLLFLCLGGLRSANFAGF